MDVEDLRLLIYDNFRRLGRVTTRREMATTLGVTEQEVTDGIAELARRTTRRPRRRTARS